MLEVDKSRTIIIGDVHGCLDELETLLDKVNFKPGKDSLTFLGDIINRGPYSKETFIRLLELKANAVLGNHEWHVLNSLKSGQQGWQFRKLKSEFGSSFQRFMEEIACWPVFIETDDTILVHGGLVPGEHPALSNPRILTSIRTWDGHGKNLNDPSNPPWFDLYSGDKLVVFGHWAALEGIIKTNLIGIDTGCVYGKKLTALILPTRELVSVPAGKEYFPVGEPEYY
jgi:calcineurin-like phosphoesterase family protein